MNAQSTAHPHNPVDSTVTATVEATMPSTRKQRLLSSGLLTKFQEYQDFLREALRQTMAFRQSSDAELDMLSAICEPHHLVKDEILFRQGNHIHGLYIVARGAVFLQVQHSKTRKHLYGAFHAGDIFGESSLHDESPCPLECRALEDSVVLRIPADKLLQFLHSQPALAIQVILSMSRRIDKLVSQLSDFKVHAVEDRFLSWVARRIPKNADSAGIQLGVKRILAAELGVTAETLSRLQRKLKETNLVVIKGRNLFIPNCKAFWDYFLRSTQQGSGAEKTPAPAPALDH